MTVINEQYAYRLAKHGDKPGNTDALPRWTAICDLRNEDGIERCGEEIDIDAANVKERQEVLKEALKNYDEGLFVRKWIKRVPGFMYF
jgi:hypothetical protein